MLILALLLSLGALAPDQCEKCSLANGEVQLCAPHASEERRVLTAQRNRLRLNKDPEQRRVAVETIAALTRAHENCPSPRVAEALGLALADDSLGVRIEAARQLGLGQHAPTAARVLSEAAHDLPALFRGELEPVLDIELPQELSPVDPEQRRAWLDTCDEWDRRSSSDSLVQAYAESLGGALARLRLPEAEDALLELWLPVTRGEAADVFLALGTRRGIERVLDWLQLHEESAQELRLLLERLEGPSPPAPPAAFSSVASWKRAQEQVLELRQTHLVALKDALERFARSRGLEQPKGWIGPTELWRGWYAQHLDGFSERITAGEN